MSGLPPGFVLEPDPVAPPPSASGLPSGFTLDTPDLFSGLTNTAARWATFGLTDPVGAAAQSLGQKLKGSESSFGDLYHQNIEAKRGQAENFSQAHPYANALAALGGVLTGGAPIGALGPGTEALMAAPRQGLFSRMGQGAATGAGIGAASGFSNSNADDALGMAKDIGFGSLGGAVVGGALPAGAALLARPAAAAARQLFPSAVESQGLGLLGGRIAQDAAAGGPNPAAIEARLGEAGGSPLSIADVGGENLQALAGRMTRTQGEPREIATNFLGDRMSGMAPRLIQSIDQNLSGGNAFQAAQDLIAHRNQSAAPLYDQAFAAPTATSDRLAQFLKDPDIQRGLANGQEIQRREALAAGQPMQVAPPRTSLVEPGTPDLRTLDMAKAGLDDMVEQYRDPTTGRLQLDRAGRALDQVRRSFINELDQVYPDYATARQAWAGPSAALSAMKQGQGFRNMRPELVEKTVSELGPSEQEFFRLGAADSLRGAVGKAGTATSLIGSNAVNERGSDYLQQQLRPLFPSQDAFDRFVKDASHENLIFANTGKMVGNSATAARMAEDRGGGHNASALANLAGAGSAFYSGEPVAGVGLLARALGALSNIGEINNPRVNAAAARRLFSADPTQNTETLAKIMAGRPSTLPAISFPGSYVAGSLYPRYELMPGERGRAP